MTRSWIETVCKVSVVGGGVLLAPPAVPPPAVTPSPVALQPLPLVSPTVEPIIEWVPPARWTDQPVGVVKPVAPNTVPEPSSLILTVGAAGILLLRRRQRRHTA